MENVSPCAYLDFMLKIVDQVKAKCCARVNPFKNYSFETLNLLGDKKYYNDPFEKYHTIHNNLTD